MQSPLQTEDQRQKPKPESHGPDGPVAPLWQSKRDCVVWSVAGFDPSSGAGVTADLLTFAALGLFGCSAITALTVQSTRGVFGSEPVSAEVLASTLARLDEDLPPVGIKVGMLATPELAAVVADFLREKRHRGKRPIVVLDPVLRSSSGRELFPEAGLDALRRDLLPFVNWMTPNWAELAVLAGMRVNNLQGAETAGRSLLERYTGLGIVVTGGDQEQPVDLLLQPGEEAVILRGRRVDTTSTHGTGCAFSSALLAGLVQGTAELHAIQQAKAYVEGALLRAPGVGGGKGPMELLWPLLEGNQPTDLVP